jgi:hypothetical protein
MAYVEVAMIHPGVGDVVPEPDLGEVGNVLPTNGTAVAGCGHCISGGDDDRA